MVIKIDSGGQITSVPSSVPMGTILKDVMIIAPQYSATAVLRVKPPYQERLPDIVCVPAINDANFVVFTARIPAEVTRWAGRVGYQLIFTDADGEATATFAGTLNVQDGVAVENPESAEDLGAYTMEDLYQLLTNATLLHSRITELNGVVGIGEELDTDAQTVIAAINELLTTITDTDAVQLTGRVETLEGQVADLLYKAIAFTRAAVTPSLAELGSTVNQVLVTWGLNKTPTAQKVNGAAVDAAVRNYTGSGEFTETTAWNIEATDERDAVARRSAILYFENGIFAGVGSGDIADLTGADLTSALESVGKNLSSVKARIFTATALDGQYIWYCLPSRLGTCTFKVGGFDGGFTRVAEKDFTNASGYTEEYIFYRSDNEGLGLTTVTVW